MILLLDTHVWIWSQESPDRIGPKCRETLLSPRAAIFISSASTLEISRLVALRRLAMTLNLLTWIQESAKSLNATGLVISNEIAVEAYSLPPPFHRDLADRLLVASARLHDLRLVTADDQIIAYPHVLTLDARA